MPTEVINMLGLESGALVALAGTAVCGWLAYLAAAANAHKYHVGRTGERPDGYGLDAPDLVRGSAGW